MKGLVILLAAVVAYIPSHAGADVSVGSRGEVVTEVQTILKGYGYSVVVDGQYGPQTEKAVRSWQKSNGLLVDGIVGPITLSSLRSATRLNNAQQVTPTLPPAGLQGKPFAPAGLSDCDEMNFYRQQWNLPESFSSLGWRESNCRNEESVHTFCCWGYWQLHQQHVRSGYAARWRSECGITSYTDFNSDTPLEKQKQACGAFILYDISGLGPWAL